MQQLRILVVGGGIGGLSFAGLQAARGSTVLVVEREPEWRTTSSGISMHPIAIRALDRLGLLDDVAARGSVHDEIEHHDSSGTLIDVTHPPRLAGPDKPTGAGIMRSELHDILATRATDAGAEIRLGLTVERIEHEGAAGVVTFSDGMTETFDLIVGADGSRSSVRRLVFDSGAEPLEPHYTGTMSWRAVVPRHPDIHAISIYYGPIVAGANPVSADQMYLFLLAPSTEPERVADADLAPRFRQFLQPFTGPLAVAREQVLEPSQVVVRPIESLLTPTPWSRGRVVLIADAVHAVPPTLATGGGMAMEDAVVLNDELVAAESVESALQRYEERRWPRSRDAVERTLAHLAAIAEHREPAEIARLEGLAHQALAVPL